MCPGLKIDHFTLLPHYSQLLASELALKTLYIDEKELEVKKALINGRLAIFGVLFHDKDTCIYFKDIKSLKFLASGYM